ncbi:hypothetical membrane associated protein [Streptococcus pyogenes]|uniref:hypothetical protein n=1 Tax=Streptococcus pyogenes TaxID=1314 RepID=UPI0010A1B18A|nr:hypothetical protein [Streptococcus pyogenes]VGQ40470.1 hypothetical membrane associated protein [Streptococcus pyogenes]
MKTKSKRFLKLATLCLALLSTTLLTTQPVKAEAVAQTTEGKVTKTEDRDNVDAEAKEYQRRWDAGYEEGYEKGKEPGSPRQPREIPKGTGEGYSDGYEGGYKAGWLKGHPVDAFLEMAWNFLTYAFTSLFGSGSSQ